MSTTELILTKTYPGLKPDRKYYKIGGAARLIGVKTSTLRHWEDPAYSWPKPLSFWSGGQRRYTVKQMLVLMQIHYLQQLVGLTLDGVSQAMKEGHADVLVRLYGGVPVASLWLSD